MNYKSSLDKILANGKTMILAYDHGIEHGPTDFNEKNVDPSYIMEIAEKGKFNAIVFQKGLAEKYYNGKVPLILKVNGKTNLTSGDPISLQNCSVEYAISLGAVAIGYTVYPGSVYERFMFKELGKIHEKAREYGLAVIVWVYPRGNNIKNETSKDVVAYAARVGLELGADMVKIKYTGDPDSFRWAVKSAGKTKVVMSGGPKTQTEKDFLLQVKGVIDAGGAGVAVGRNVWQSKNPLEMSFALRKLIFENKNIDEVLNELTE
ncbi:MAG: class I fructose-bisphosphate aldolase [Caldisphaera sp.]